MSKGTQKSQFSFSRDHCCEVTVRNVRKVNIFFMFWAINQLSLELVKFQVPWYISIRNISYLSPMCCHFWQKKMHKQPQNWSGCSTPLIGCISSQYLRVLTHFAWSHYICMDATKNHCEHWFCEILIKFTTLYMCYMNMNKTCGIIKSPLQEPTSINVLLSL